MKNHFVLRFVAVITVALVVSLSIATCEGATKVTVGTEISVAQQVSMDQIEHQPWDALLKRYVDSNGNVNYAAWKQSAGDRQTLVGYLAHLSSAGPSIPATQATKLVFWINAYNAVTVEGLLREYPTSSIRNHTAKVFG